MVASLLLLGGAAATTSLSFTAKGQLVAHVFDQKPNENAEKDLANAFDGFAAGFDEDAYKKIELQIHEGEKTFLEMTRAKSFTLAPGQPHCDAEPPATVKVQAAGSVDGIAAFPGGAVKKLFGSSLADKVFSLAQQAAGPAAASQNQLAIVAAQALQTGVGMVQSAIATAVHVVPPMVPPPVWNNQPLTCMPMLHGHNCFGAVLHPITASDFVISDVTDSMLNGAVAGFPNTYANKVGKTSDAMYRACFASYMSMMCSSLFPRCTTVQTREETMPAGGRVPMCFHMCVSTLVLCPGFWLNDIIGACSMVSVPPLCTQAVFWNTGLAPPQYVNFDESHPFAAECPPALEAGRAAAAGSIVGAPHGGSGSTSSVGTASA